MSVRGTEGGNGGGRRGGGGGGAEDERGGGAEAVQCLRYLPQAACSSRTRSSIALFHAGGSNCVRGEDKLVTWGLRRSAWC